MATRRDLLRAASAVSLSGAWARSARAQGAGGTLTVALSDNPITCDPINMISHDSEIISQTIFENLVEMTVDGELRPQLAKALPEISADKLIYSFELRDDVSFQNGEKMTAEDVKYSFDYMLDTAHKAARGPIFNRLSRVEADGPYRVHVHLKEPYAPWTSFLTKFMGIWPKGSREQLGDEYFRLRPAGVGTGPGIFEEWHPNDYVSLRRNPNYWQKGLPHWDRLVIKIVPEDATRVAYLLGGQADIIGAPPPRDFERLKARKGISGQKLATLGGWSVMMLNNSRPPFDDVNFRLAIAHATDRETITQKINFGLAEAAALPAPRSSWWYNDAADKSLAFDMDLAKSYLAKSKYPTGAAFELLSSSDVYLLDTKDVAVFMQSQLAKLGIKVNLRFAEGSVITPLMLRGEYDAMLRNLMSPGEPTYLTMVNFTANQFMTKSSHFFNARVEELMRMAFAETDQSKLKPVYAELMQVLADQSPYVWIGFFDAANLWRDRVRTYKVSRGLTINVHDVAVG